MILNTRDEDRYAAVVVSPSDLLAGMFTPSRPGYSTRVLEGLPKDTAFIGFEYSHDWGGNWSDEAAAVFVFRHESFALISVGQPLPIISVVFQSVFRAEEAT